MASVFLLGGAGLGPDVLTLSYRAGDHPHGGGDPAIGDRPARSRLGCRKSKPGHRVASLDDCCEACPVGELPIPSAADPFLGQFFVDGVDEHESDVAAIPDENRKEVSTR